MGVIYYVALLLCWSTGVDQHCEWRSITKPVVEGDAYWGGCKRSDTGRFRAWYVGPRILCAHAPLQYPPMAAPIPSGRFA
jgi:hypothetical protein